MAIIITQITGTVHNVLTGNTYNVGDAIGPTDVIAVDTGKLSITVNGTDYSYKAGETIHATQFAGAEQTTDVTSLQAEIAAGADPSQITEAPAAGATAEQGNEGHSAVTVAYNAPEAVVTSGFDTTGPQVAFIDSVGDIVSFINTDSNILPSPLEKYAPVVKNWNDSEDNGLFSGTLDNKVLDVTITNTTTSDNPGTQAIFVGDLLRSGQALPADTVASNPPATTILGGTSDLTFTFISEGAGYKNTVGWYDVNNPTVGHVIWNNSSAIHSGGDLIPGASTYTATNVPAGTQVGFFLIKNLYSNTTDIPETVNFRDGKSYLGNNEIGHETFFSNHANLDGLQHVLTGVAAGEAHTLYVTFEDLTNGGDKDYEDVIFKVDLGEYTSTAINADVFNVGASITDQDSTNIAKAVLTFNLGDGDTVTYTGVAGLDIVRDGNAFTITGDSLISDYNTLLNSFVIEVGHTGTSDDYTLIDTADRHSFLQVWDTDGLASNVDTATYKLNITETNTESLVDLNNGTNNEDANNNFDNSAGNTGNNDDTGRQANNTSNQHSSDSDTGFNGSDILTESSENEIPGIPSGGSNDHSGNNQHSFTTPVSTGLEALDLPQPDVM